MKIKTLLTTSLFLLSTGLFCMAQSLNEKPPTLIKSKRVLIHTTMIRPAMLNPVGDFTQLAVKDKHGKCTLHHHSLQKAIVPVEYGFRIELGDERNAQFPNAINLLQMCCEVGSNAPSRAIVFQCRKCLEARKVWREKQMARMSKEKNNRTTQ